MAWHISCEQPNCRGKTAYNICDLIENYLDDRGLFRCKCGGAGYIERKLKLMEGEEATFLYKGILMLDPNPKEGETYFPFVFLTSSDESGEIDCVHFRYFKDTRHMPGGGQLKFGDGPGSGPIVGLDSVSRQHCRRSYRQQLTSHLRPAWSTCLAFSPHSTDDVEIVVDASVMASLTAHGPDLRWECSRQACSPQGPASHSQSGLENRAGAGTRNRLPRVRRVRVSEDVAAAGSVGTLRINQCSTASPPPR